MGQAVPSLQCWVSLQESFEGVPVNAEGLTLLTFDFPHELLAPRFHTLQCGSLAAEYKNDPHGMPCTAATKTHEGSLVIGGALKEDLTNLPLLSLTLASQTGLPFDIWLLSACCFALGICLVLLAMLTYLLYSVGKCACYCVG